jgi:aminoglycoside phosphotransferase family enzyme
MAEVPPLIQAMLAPSWYPHRPKKVELVQTHISYILLADGLVYKVKKPVDFGFLNFTSLEQRRFFCREEVRLNQRFSPDIYLAVDPISRVADRYRLGDETAVVEYAVKMRRIDEAHMLYRLLQAGEVTSATMQRVGKYLARAYAAIASDEKAQAFGALAVIATNVRENFAQTKQYIGGPLSAKTFATLEGWSMSFMEQETPLFAQRVAQGYIKDCHGDLHLQHICVEGDHIYVFDCIEFNERFRFGDVASDVAFLAMDLDFNGHADFAGVFTEAYAEAAGDDTVGGILQFYKVYRAYVRAKVTSFMLDDPALDDPAKREVLRRAKAYYDLALAYVQGNA